MMSSPRGARATILPAAWTLSDSVAAADAAAARRAAARAQDEAYRAAERANYGGTARTTCWCCGDVSMPGEAACAACTY